MVPPCSDKVSRASPYSLSSYRPFRLRGYHPLWPDFPDRSTKTYTTFGLFRVRSSLLAESRLISFPPGNEIFQFPGFASVPGINACCQLPRAFRRLPRPSSPLTAKASTVDAYSLDHITPSRLEVIHKTRLIASTTHLNSVRVQTLVTSQIVKEHIQASMLGRFKFMCALSYPVWWVWEDSNHRPRPYQGRALTT